MPTGEIQVTDSRMHGYGSWVLNAGLQRSSVGAVQLGYFQVLAVPVQPIQFPTHPIDGDALEAVAVVPDDLLAFRTAHLRPIYGLRAHVAEIQPLLRVIEVQRDHVQQVLMVQRVLGRVQRHVPHVVFVRENQPRFRFVAPLARAFVGRPIVISLVAFTVKRPRGVETILRTRAGHLFAFVNIVARFTVFH